TSRKSQLSRFAMRRDLAVQPSRSCGYRVPARRLLGMIICARSSGRRRAGVSPVGSDHHVGRLDNGDGRLTFGELQLINGLVCYRSSHHGSAEIDTDMRRGGALNDVNNLAFELIARADLHGLSSILAPWQGPNSVTYGGEKLRRQADRRHDALPS